MDSVTVIKTLCTPYESFSNWKLVTVYFLKKGCEATVDSSACTTLSIQKYTVTMFFENAFTWSAATDTARLQGAHPSWKVFCVCTHQSWCAAFISRTQVAKLAMKEPSTSFSISIMQNSRLEPCWYESQGALESSSQPEKSSHRSTEYFLRKTVWVQQREYRQILLTTKDFLK